MQVTPKFKIGDRVVEARRMDFGNPPENKAAWTANMTKGLGKEFAVTDLYVDGRHFRLDDGFYYFDGCLKPAKYGNEED